MIRNFFFAVPAFPSDQAEKSAGGRQTDRGGKNMAQTGVRLEISQEIIQELSSEETKLWIAAHDDGSKNRINSDTIMDAATITFSFAAVVAGFLWLKKKFKNLGKTKEDLAAEKEAAKINGTCTALKQMLLEYLSAAQNGAIDEAAMDELIDTLEEMHGYQQSGKLIVSGRKELAEIRKSITEFTGSMAVSKAAPPPQPGGAAGGDDFFLIREQLMRQKRMTAA